MSSDTPPSSEIKPQAIRMDSFATTAPTLRSFSHSSNPSSDSCTNLVGGNSGDKLPSYWRSESDEGIEKEKQTGFFLGWRIILLGSWLNVLLILIPISWTLSFTMHNSHALIFAFCILALVPLVKLHDLATRELAVRIGGSKTGLLNASMSNIVEIAVAVSALRKCELRVVQSSLIGSMLSKLLLVLGLCFFAGGMRFSEQGFDATATQIHSSLLSLSVGAVLLPAAYHFSLSGGTDVIPDWQIQNILHMSHSVSIVLLLIYVAYLVFQLWSHSHLYSDSHNKKSKRLTTTIALKEPYFRMGKEKMKDTTVNNDGSPYNRNGNDDGSLSLSDLTAPRVFSSSPRSSIASSSKLNLTEYDMEKNNIANPTVKLVRGATRSPIARSKRTLSEDSNGSSIKIGRESKEENLKGDTSKASTVSEDENGEVPVKEPRVSWLLAVSLLVIVTITASITADWLVESMDGISSKISKEWIGLILLPAVTSIAECMTAVNVSVKDQLTLSISVAVGSTIQTALFVIPFIITLAWAMGKPLSLLMDPFESLVLYMAVQTMSYVVADGKSNWLEGVILICLYIIIAVSFWFYPGSNLPESLAVCAISS